MITSVNSILPAKPKSHLFMFDELHVKSVINWRLIYFFCLLVLTPSSKNPINLPDDVAWSRPMINADPWVDSQSRKEIRRRSRILEEEDKTAMMLGRDRGENESGTEILIIIISWTPWWHAHVKNPPSLTTLCLAHSFSPFLSLWSVSTNCGCHLFSAGVCET